MAKRPLISLKQRLYARFNHRIDNPKDRKRSAFFAEWIDLGFLRHRWTNDGEVAPGVFRANNPDEKRFETYSKSGIRTVLNLRNDTERAPSRFAEERARANGMVYVSHPMTPRHAPTKDELLGLIDVFPTLEKPILIHCKSGADRTGLAAAIWRLTREGESLDQARSELSLKYIHRRDSETGVLDEVLDAFEPHESKMSFRDWVIDVYDSKAAETRSTLSKPKRGVLGTLKHLYKDIYTYAQHREMRWHESFEREIVSEQDKRRARFFMRWVDHGILRGVWTNFHQIRPGIYRSNHPTEKRFREYAKQGFRTIINLRGASMAPQYQLEKSLCSELGLTLVDIPMSGSSAPPKDTVQNLLKSFENSDRPAIIHCKSGADRTGLASALYLISEGVSPEKARNQLALKYLHLRRGSKGILGWVIDQFTEENRRSPLSLNSWIQKKYDPETLTRGFHALRGSGNYRAVPAPSTNPESAKKIAVLTSVRNDTSFLDRWIDYYSKAFGSSSLFVILDGFDQPVPDAEGVNFIRVPYVPRSVVAGDKARASRASKLAETLLRTYDIVIGTDVDEFVCVDPNTGMTLADYLSHLEPKGPISPLGLDVAQHIECETTTDPSKPFLNQRGFAKISDRYTKSSILSAPARWGSGYHRVRGENLNIDPNLFLFHFGSIDRKVSEKRKADPDRISEGWSAHQRRRDTLFDEISKADPVEGDSRFESARLEMAKKRPLHAWNKPGALKKDAIISIPERFRDLI